ncbi:MAG TPA: hypothetical protein PKY10_05850 [Lentisphaeria bacterium]|nr:hypothetical protein [Lentisphaeria bacterium]
MATQAQLIIQGNDDQTAAALFQRHRAWQPDSLPATVGGKGCDCVLEGCTGTLFTIVEDEGDKVKLMPAPKAEISINSAPCPSHGQLLRSGDKVTAGTAKLHFYTVRKQEKPSLASLFLARLSKTLVALFLLAQLWVLFILPNQIRDNRFWERAIDKQRISSLLDQLRRDVSKLEAPEAGQKALQAALLAELDARVRYMRQYEDRMTRSQRRAMQEDLQEIQRLTGRLSAGQIMQPLPPLQTDQAVQAIVGDHH